MNSFSPLLGSLFVVLGAALLRLWRKRRVNLPLPPSPTSYPVIGHLLSIPTRDEHLGFVELGKQLKSDIFSLNVFGQQLVVLNSSQSATDLLEKRSSVYSDRVCPPMIAEPSLMNWANFASLVGYNDRWKKSRRLMHPWFHKGAVEDFYQSQQNEARLLLQRLLKSADPVRNSEDLLDEFYIAFSSTLTTSIYGHKVQSLDDEFVTGIKEATDNFARAASPSMNLFPALMYIPGWLPGMGWKKTARQWGEQQERFVDKTYGWAKARVTTGEDDSSIIAGMLTHAERLGIKPEERDDYIKQIAVTLFAAGTDTSALTLLIFVLAMILFPEVQHKAQAEIDEMIGSDRLPTIEDRPALGYVSRLVEEVLRWRPAGPLGMPHACYKDDVYRGYKIPKGAIVIGNIWAINHDPNIYKNPETFDPDRYLDPSVPPPSTFGFGRRACPGVHFAKVSLFITIASILATFDLSLTQDENGNDMIPAVESDNQVVFHPKPFKLRMTPRSNASADLIQSLVVE
ncbi:cytochrome P450 family protein [Ceratobasidium sp. AG-Ba]|nr:cytochrome P450 family protein [Ceratobasidium sp. AG-Ba]QRV99592.1 cytochrome P450 family protein [Ceratobasidium sp. AG-Ba]QRW14116.1 cytochrome P450 family protein [Ceratobasidium sp. AG-Ba]